VIKKIITWFKGISNPLEPIVCDRCNKNLKELGGILLSPPNKSGMVKKHHLCCGCYYRVVNSNNLNESSDKT
jgi:hypothetical protein